MVGSTQAQVTTKFVVVWLSTFIHTVSSVNQGIENFRVCLNFNSFHC